MFKYMISYPCNYERCSALPLTWVRHIDLLHAQLQPFLFLCQFLFLRHTICCIRLSSNHSTDNELCSKLYFIDQKLQNSKNDYSSVHISSKKRAQRKSKITYYYLGSFGHYIFPELSYLRYMDHPHELAKCLQFWYQFLDLLHTTCCMHRSPNHSTHNALYRHLEHIHE